MTNAEIIRAATNNPALSKRTFRLGSPDKYKDFTIVDLKYDDYMQFVLLMTPLIDSFLKGLSEGVSLSDASMSDIVPSGVSAMSVISYCAEDLPELARIVCKQTEPEITVEEIKELAGTPFPLAELVLVQIDQNRMVSQFADFFGRMLTMLKGSLSQLKTKETPSSSSPASVKPITGPSKKRSS